MSVSGSNARIALTSVVVCLWHFYPILHVVHSNRCNNIAADFNGQWFVWRHYIGTLNSLGSASRGSPLFCPRPETRGDQGNLACPVTPRGVSRCWGMHMSLEGREVLPCARVARSIPHPYNVARLAPSVWVFHLEAGVRVLLGKEGVEQPWTALPLRSP